MRMGLHQILNKMFSQCLLGHWLDNKFPLWCILVDILCVCVDDLSIAESGVLKSPTIPMLKFISPFRSKSADCIYLDVHIYGCYVWWILWNFHWNVMSIFWWQLFLFCFSSNFLVCLSLALHLDSYVYFCEVIFLKSIYFYLKGRESRVTEKKRR